MDKISTNIKERILQIPVIKCIAKETFFENLGVSYGNFKGKSKLSDIGAKTIADISAMYPDVNIDWLITGKGHMLHDIEEVKRSLGTIGAPLYPVYAFAGLGFNGDASVELGDIELYIDIPQLKGKVDFYLTLSGSSMYPKYSSGDIVACKKLHELLYIQWNRAHVLYTQTQGVMVKRLVKSKNEKTVICRSDNKEYEDFEVPIKDIKSIALVVGVTRFE